VDSGYLECYAVYLQSWRGYRTSQSLKLKALGSFRTLLTLLHSITSQKASSFNINNVQTCNIEHPILFNLESPGFILNTSIMVFGHLGMKLTYIL